MQKILYRSIFIALLTSISIVSSSYASKPLSLALDLLSSQAPIISLKARSIITENKVTLFTSKTAVSHKLSLRDYSLWSSSAKKKTKSILSYPKAQSRIITRAYSQKIDNEGDTIKYAGLSIDGGGIRGLVYAKVLAEIEKELRTALKKEDFHLHEAFDYIGGTSIGGALALALVTPENSEAQTPLSLNKWITRFTKNVGSIMPNTRYNFFKQFWGVRYSDDGYRRLLGEWFTDITLKDVLNNVVVTSTQFESRQPFIFTKEAANNPDYNYHLKDVVRATTSVVSQFKPVKITSLSGKETPEPLVDGGICYNNTSQFVYNRIQKKTGATRKNVLIVSIGTDISARDNQENTGLIWLAPLQVNHFMAGANDGVESEMAGLLGDNYIRFKPDSSINNIAFNDTSPNVAQKLDEAANHMINSQRTQITNLVSKLTPLIRRRQFSTSIKPLEPKEERRMYNVLSIDGGGIRGLIPALILNKIEQLTEKRAYELFDYIGGTSTGGLITLGLTVPNPESPAQARYSAIELANIFQGEERYLVFAPSWRIPLLQKPILAISQVFRTAYSAKAYERLLRDKFKNVFMEEALTNILVTCTKFNNKNMIVFTKQGKEKGATTLPGRYLMREVARATSAAPSYFLPGEVTEPETDNKDSHRFFYVDGGICCNNPAQLVWNHMQRKYENATINNTYFVSLGTGYHGKRPWYAPKENSGFLRWIPSLNQYFMEGNSFSVHEELVQLFGSTNYIRVQEDLGRSIDLAGVDEKNLKHLINAANSIIENKDRRIDKIAYQLLKNKGFNIPATLEERVRGLM